MDPSALLDLAVRLGREAREAILAVRRAGFVVERKGDASPVTAADRLAEGIITEGLRVTGLPVIAEEAAEAGALPEAGSRFWLVDPLDGTKEFAAGLDEWCACIALVEGGRATLGVLAGPGRLYAGIVGEGAWAEDGDGPRRAIRSRVPPAEGLTVLASRSHHSETRHAEFVAAHRVARVVPMGSALKYGVLAEGGADVVPRLGGRTMEWDTAAGQAVLEAAGGVMLDAAGGALRYGKPGFQNRGYIAWGQPPA
ncbi:MAG: 3'(2'),5'-bisphosphate nucleotidase CysQ [Acetobacteraceae bacterium]|nr:3'(2'),5'-bisphosphate nucleotidase CysQ [Acetobacteraceae bacterium]